MREPAGEAYIDPAQPALPGLGPVAGERYRSMHTNSICTVLRAVQGRHAWVVVRVRDGEYTFKLATFLEHWTRI